jgi:uncharacterized protein (DUF1330 family)
MERRAVSSAQGPVPHIEATDENGRLVFQRGIEGPVVMLNLLRFRDQADYSEHPELAPAEPIGGRAAYQRYVEHAVPFLTAIGGEVRFVADGGHPLIGPVEERWDLVMLVRHVSLGALMAMTEDPGYMAGYGHRVAALEDSRLIPVVETG